MIPGVNTHSCLHCITLIAANDRGALVMKKVRHSITIRAAVAVAALSFAGSLYFAVTYGGAPKLEGGVAKAAESPDSSPTGRSDGSPPTDSVELAESQLKFVKVAPAEERDFPIEKASVGSIDFNEELLTQVFTPYQGRVIGLFAKVGDEVQKGQTLFTIESPDLLAADSNLIAAAGVLELTTRNLTRLKTLFSTRAISQKDLEQAVSDQQTAEGALRAARDAIRIFGKTDAEIDLIVKERRADPTLVVPSPISGRITARNAAPGLWCSQAIRRHPTSSPISPPCGCLPMLRKATFRHLPSAKRSRSASRHFRTGYLQDTSPLSIQRLM